MHLTGASPSRRCTGSFLYGFIGWGVEVVYAAIKTHKLVNRGVSLRADLPDLRLWHGGADLARQPDPMPDSGSMSAVAIFFHRYDPDHRHRVGRRLALFKIYHIRWWTTPT